MTIAVILLLFIAFQNQEKVVNSVVESYEKAEFQKFNPINTNLNLSSINLKGITNQIV